VHPETVIRGLWGLVVVALIACGGNAAPPSPRPTLQAPPATTVEPEPELPDIAATAQLVDTACPRVTGPYFYRVEKAGKVSHLLGTRHMSVSLDKMPKVVRDRLLAARLVVFETAPGDDSDAGLPEPDRRLSEALGDTLWKKYAALVGEDTAAMVDAAGPATALVALMVLFEHKAALLDVEIERLVTDANIETAGLETSAFQDRLLSELLDLRMLRTAIKGTPNRATLRKASMEDLAEYCAGTDTDPGTDASARAQLQVGGYSDAEIDTMDRKLLDDRNQAWLPQLETLLPRGDVVIVVGADHLIGKRGLVALLGAKGFRITRVRP